MPDEDEGSDRGDALDLTAKERVLLHLKDFQRHTSDSYMPAEVTQKGISDSIGIRPSHVPRTLKRLRDESLVEERSAHVQGSPRRLKVYFLTSPGMKAALELTERVAQVTSSSAGTLGELYARENAAGGFWRFVRRHGGRGGVEVVQDGAAGAFLGRKEELKQAVEFARGARAGTLVVYGPKGIGKTTLVLEALRIARTRSLTVDLAGVNSRAELERRLFASLGHGAARDEAARDGAAGDDPGNGLGHRLADAAKVLFLDSYFEMREEVVDSLRSLVHEAIGAGMRVIVAAPETIPAYSRFYHNDEVRSGVVTEMRVKGLDLESGRALLGTVNLEDYRRVDLYAKGSPLIILLLKARDLDGLAKASRFSREEVKHLLFVYEQAVARTAGRTGGSAPGDRGAVKL